MINKVINGLKNPVAWLTFGIMFVGFSIVQHKVGLSKMIQKGQQSIDGENSFLDKIFG